MSKSIEWRRVSAALLVAACVVLPTGCINPFLPSSDITLTDLVSSNNSSDEIDVYQSDTTGTLDLTKWEATATFRIKNKVTATITSINVEYTDLSGSPVTPYKLVGGKSFKTHYRLTPMTTANGNVGGVTTSLTIYIVDALVVNELVAPSYPSNKFMFAVVTFRGEDDNGYDFKLSAKLGIKYFP